MLHPVIDANTKPRIDWKTILGYSVDTLSAHYYNQGEPWEYCFYKLTELAAMNGVEDLDSIKKLKIAVCSNYSRLKRAKK